MYERIPANALELRPLDVFTYSPKQSVVAVMISEVEKAQNRGPAQVLNLIKERSAIGEETMVNEICTDLNGDGTGRSSKTDFLSRIDRLI